MYFISICKQELEATIKYSDRNPRNKIKENCVGYEKVVAVISS